MEFVGPAAILRRDWQHGAMADSVLFTHGTVFDGRRHLGAADVLVTGGEVVSAGPPGEVAVHLRDAGDVERVDCTGRLVAPGFVDAHVHTVQGGLERVRCDLSEGGSREEHVDLVGRYTRDHPERTWVLGGGWAMAAFPGGTPTADDLDRAVADRPAFLPNRDHHGAWVNTRALELAGITRETPDPPDGRIERDADGRPTGTLHEGAMLLVSRLLPATTDADYDRALLAGQAHLHSLGVTGWQDAIVGAYAGMDDIGPAYRRAAERGDLVSHVVGALWWQRERGLDQVEELVARRAELTRGPFRATTVKIMQDGVPENFTAAMTTPYLDRCGHATSNSGHSFVDPELLREAVVALDAAGFQVHVHAIGDRGIREALDAFEGTVPALRRQNRHHIAHLQVVHPDDVPRFARLGVAANVQALWACHDDQMVELNMPFLGEERSRWQYPFGDLLRAGAHLGCGSDWPVTSPDPLAAMHVAVNRAAYGAHGREGDDPFLPEQSLTLEQVWRAYTSGSAWLDHCDDRGVLEAGRVADLVVVDRDPFDAPSGQIGAAEVSSTWVAGRCVYAVDR